MFTKTQAAGEEEDWKDNASNNIVAIAVAVAAPATVVQLRKTEK